MIAIENDFQFQKEYLFAILRYCQEAYPLGPTDGLVNLIEFGLPNLGTGFALKVEVVTRMSSMKSEILDNQQLAERWHLSGTADAIAKRFQRLRALPKSNPRHLRALRIGNQIRYRLTDILEYEDRNVGKRRANLSAAV